MVWDQHFHLPLYVFHWLCYDIKCSQFFIYVLTFGVFFWVYLLSCSATSCFFVFLEFLQVSIVGETIWRLRWPWWKEWKKPIWGLMLSSKGKVGYPWESTRDTNIYHLYTKLCYGCIGGNCPYDLTLSTFGGLDSYRWEAKRPPKNPRREMDG